MEEIKDLQKGVNSILVEIGKLQTEMKNLSAIPMQVAANERSTLLLEHTVVNLTTRLDTLEKNIALSEQVKKADKKWVIGLVPGMAAIVWKLLEFL